MTTPITTTTGNSQMHNDIMADGFRDRSPMLATGRYAQWHSRFIRYVDTKPNSKELRKCILHGPYNITLENRAHFDAKAEAIHMILSGIRDFIPKLMHVKQHRRCEWPLNDYNKVAAEGTRCWNSTPEIAGRSKDGSGPESVASVLVRLVQCQKDQARTTITRGDKRTD
ncbi:hypothetical protein Tco_0086887 [Tanacetum coccineum]